MAAKYALYMGVFLLLRFAVEVSMQQYIWLTMLYLALSVLVPFYAYRLAKMFVQQTNEPTVSFSDFYTFTFFLFVFASLILTIGQYVFYQYISPNYITDMHQGLIENLKLLESQYPSFNTYQEILVNSPMPSSLQMATQSIWMYSIAGIILGLINAAIYRYSSKKTKTPEQL
jgi:ABC-type multidrug transport system fused ATPase/permease subunit